MGWYDIFKYLHVVAVIVWLGGGLILIILAIAADRRKNDADYLHVVRDVAYLGVRVFVPSSLGALLTGIAATSIAGLWSALWVNIGLVGFAATFITGAFIIKPRADRLAALIAAGKTMESVDAGRRLLRISKFDYVMLFTVAADMVLKPSSYNWVTLVVMAAVVAAGAAYFVVLPNSRAAAPA